MILCAAIPYRFSPQGAMEVLLVTSRSKGRWILPKGKVEPGMTASACARREVYEEAGASGVVDQVAVARLDLPNKRREAGPVDCHMQIFALEVDAVALTWPEMFQRRRRWIDLATAIQTVKAPHFRKALKAFASSQAPVC